MDRPGLNPLFKSSQPTTQATKPTGTWSEHAPADSHLQRELALSDSRVAQLKRELEKSDTILKENFAKLALKKREKEVLKSELESARRTSGDWETRYNQLALSHQELQGTSKKVVVEGKDLKKALEKAEAKVKEISAELKAVNDERPLVQEKLQIGGAAFRRVKALETVKLEDERQISRLKEQSAAQAQQIKLLEQELASFKDRAATGDKVNLKTVQADLVAVKEKLRASALDVQAKNNKLASCATMLVKTDQVLKACSQLHAGKEGSAALSQALAETSRNLAAFLSSLQVKSG